MDGELPTIIVVGSREEHNGLPLRRKKVSVFHILSFDIISIDAGMLMSCIVACCVR
jgi:hypothetical protein